MCNFLTPLRGVETYAVVVRMVLAFVCSALIGFERSAKNQPAGMRTHILVCMASTVAATCGIFLYLKLELVSDISRIASMVVTGLGFIGAGTIEDKQKTAIRGLTTAAGLWTTGIIGICIGAGFYELAVVGTFLVLLAETVFAKFALKIGLRPVYEFTVYYREKEALDEVMRYCKSRRMYIRRLRIHSFAEGESSQYVANINIRGNASPSQLLEAINSRPDIISAEYRKSEEG